MKVKTTRQEIRECVENAVLRALNEGKSFRGQKDWSSDGKKGGKNTPKQNKVKGNKGNQWKNYKNYDEDEEYTLNELSTRVMESVYKKMRKL